MKQMNFTRVLLFLFALFMIGACETDNVKNIYLKYSGSILDTNGLPVPDLEVSICIFATVEDTEMDNAKKPFQNCRYVTTNSEGHYTSGERYLLVAQRAQGLKLIDSYVGISNFTSEPMEGEVKAYKDTFLSTSEELATEGKPPKGTSIVINSTSTIDLLDHPQQTEDLKKNLYLDVEVQPVIFVGRYRGKKQVSTDLAILVKDQYKDGPLIKYQTDYASTLSPFECIQIKNQASSSIANLIVSSCILGLKIEDSDPNLLVSDHLVDAFLYMIGLITVADTRTLNLDTFFNIYGERLNYKQCEKITNSRLFLEDTRNLFYQKCIPKKFGNSRKERKAI